MITTLATLSLSCGDKTQNSCKDTPQNKPCRSDGQAIENRPALPSSANATQGATSTSSGSSDQYDSDHHGSAVTVVDDSKTAPPDCASAMDSCDSAQQLPPSSKASLDTTTAHSNAAKPIKTSSTSPSSSSSANDLAQKSPSLPTYIKLDESLPTSEVVIVGHYYELGNSDMLFSLADVLVEQEMVTLDTDQEFGVNEVNVNYWFLSKVSATVYNKDDTRSVSVQSYGRIIGSKIPYGLYTLSMERKVELVAWNPKALFIKRSYYCLINVSETDLENQDEALRIPDHGLEAFKWKTFNDRCT